MSGAQVSALDILELSRGAYITRVSRAVLRMSIYMFAKRFSPCFQQLTTGVSI